jgi:peptidoglycan/LPS O-acetylase OafA/YrhL
MMIYRLVHARASQLTIPIIAASCLLSLFGGGPSSLLAAPLTYLFITIGLTTLVLLAVSGRLKVLRCVPLVYLGEISYSLYLVHQRIGMDVLKIMHGHGFRGWTQPAAALTTALCLAIAMHHLVELPGRRWLKNVLGRPSRVADPETPDKPLISQHQ